MSCKDCIHYNVCHYHIDEETEMTVVECSNFKNKADFVEVVRCKDCRFNKPTDFTGERACIKQCAYKRPDDYCSYGDRE